MPKSKQPSRKAGTKTLVQDTSRRRSNPPRFDRNTLTAKRGSVGPKGGRPPRFPGRTGGR